MAALSSTVIDLVGGQIEAVDKSLPQLFGGSKNLASRVKASNKIQKVSRRLYRIPIELYPGGAAAKYSANGGTIGGGHSFKLSSLTAAYFYFKQSHKLTDEQMETTEDSSQSVVNAFQHEMASAIMTVEELDDIALHGDGTGLLTAAASASSAGNKLTFNGASDMLKCHRLREGLDVDVWDSGATTKRAGGPYTITAINWTTKEVTFHASVTGIQATDRCAFVGMDAYGPAAPVSFSSTFPDGALTDAAGIGGDSFRHGIEYANDNTPANYFLGVQKSTVPQLLPVYVSGSSGALTPSHIIQVIHGIQQKLGNQGDHKGLTGVFHMKQYEALLNYGMALAVKNVGESFGRSYDPVPSNLNFNDTFPFAGITCFISPRQRLNRIDFINPSMWGRAQLFDWKFYGDKSNRKVFEGRDTNGEVAAFVTFAMHSSFDYVPFEPGKSGYIDTLEVPS